MTFGIQHRDWETHDYPSWEDLWHPKTSGPLRFETAEDATVYISIMRAEEWSKANARWQRAERDIEPKIRSYNEAVDVLRKAHLSTIGVHRPDHGVRKPQPFNPDFSSTYQVVEDLLMEHPVDAYVASLKETS